MILSWLDLLSACGIAQAVFVFGAGKFKKGVLWLIPRKFHPAGKTINPTKNKKESPMYYQIVMTFDEDDSDPRYNIRPEVGKDAPEDQTTILINPAVTEKDGINLDAHGFPTAESLEAWHRKHNPQLFTD